MINNQNLAVLSEKVAALEAAIKNAGIELPSVTADDNGKTLQVVAGKWDKGMVIPELPAVASSDEGSVLQVNSSGAWIKGADFKPVTEELSTGVTIKRYGNVRQLILASVSGALNIVTLPAGDSPSVAFATIGRWKDANNLHKPCTVSVLTDGTVSASYIDSSGGAGAITDGAVLASVTYLV